MDFFFYFFFFFFFLVMSYPRKILTLFCLEGMFISCMYSYFFFGLYSNFSWTFYCFILLIFMVFDSVFGLCLLVSISRSDSLHSSWIF